MLVPATGEKPFGFGTFARCFFFERGRKQKFRVAVLHGDVKKKSPVLAFFFLFVSFLRRHFNISLVFSSTFDLD